ncbi:MAG TPA: hypothetical protein VG604_01245 [Candidatus Saccharimonadales bacterium]|nr:hypothetical protein [Candidatus Saccharimonadales bacterium]
MTIQKRFIFTAGLLLVALLLPDIANATQLTQAGVRLGRLGIGASANNDLLVTFKLNTTPTSVSKIKICLPSGFTTTSGAAPLGTTFPNTPAGITAPPGLPATATTAVGSGGCLGGSITVNGLTSASLNNTTLYGFTVASGYVTNPGLAGQYNLTVESENIAATPIDTTTTPVYIYGSSSNQDQINVTASVAPNFSFQLSSNSDAISQVDSASVKTSTGVTMTVGTDSPLGYTAYVKSANGALVSVTSPGTPITTGTFDGTPDAITAGTTKYGFLPTTGPACSTCTGALSYDTEYSSGGGAPIVSATQAGSFNSTNFASFVSRNGYTNGDQVILKERVAVANTIGYANDYSDTLTIVAAGNY